jgi:hypothetical protein
VSAVSAGSTAGSAHQAYRPEAAGVPASETSVGETGTATSFAMISSGRAAESSTRASLSPAHKIDTGMRHREGIRATGTHVHGTTLSSTTASQDGVRRLAFALVIHVRDEAVGLTLSRRSVQSTLPPARPSRLTTVRSRKSCGGRVTVRRHVV